MTSELHVVFGAGQVGRPLARRLVVPPAQAVEVVREAAAAGIRHVWLQQGAESPEALRVGAEHGLNLISGECILMFAGPTGIHRGHHWLRQITHRLPVDEIAGSPECVPSMARQP
jgi:uncharacterized protein